VRQGASKPGPSSSQPSHYTCTELFEGNSFTVKTWFEVDEVAQSYVQLLALITVVLTLLRSVTKRVSIVSHWVFT